jgi:hypothetical protein
MSVGQVYAVSKAVSGKSTSNHKPEVRSDEQGRKALPLPDLRGTEFYVQGVGEHARTFATGQSLRDFRTAYCKRTGAGLMDYSVLRDTPLPPP